MNIRLEVDTEPALVAMKTMREITKQLQAGGTGEAVMKAAVEVTTRDFHKHTRAMSQQPDPNARSEGGTSQGGSLFHVFEWGGGTRSRRLYEIVNRGTTLSPIISYIFLDSRTYVPHPDVLSDIYTTQHIFKKKAQMFESAPSVTIEQKNATMLVWEDPSHENADEMGIVRSITPTTIKSIGGGKQKDNFREAFVAWWGEGGISGKNLTEYAERLGRSLTVSMAANASAQRRHAIYTRKLNTPGIDAKAKARAKEILAKIEREMSASASRGVGLIG